MGLPAGRRLVAVPALPGRDVMDKAPRWGELRDSVREPSV